MASLSNKSFGEVCIRDGLWGLDREQPKPICCEIKTGVKRLESECVKRINCDWKGIWANWFWMEYLGDQGGFGFGRMNKRRRWDGVSNSKGMDISAREQLDLKEDLVDERIFSQALKDLGDYSLLSLSLSLSLLLLLTN